MLCVKTDLISTRLLSKEDKHDMLNGLVPVETLIIAVKCWMNVGMPDYANGHTEPLRHEPELPMQRYRGYGKSRA